MHQRLVRCHDRIQQKRPLPARTATTMIAPLAAVYSCVRPSINAGSIGRTLSSTEDVDDCFHTTITDVQYSTQLADSYSPVLPYECIDAVSLLACYGSPRSTIMRFVLHRFPSIFKRTAPLIDTNIL